VSHKRFFSVPEGLSASQEEFCALGSVMLSGAGVVQFPKLLKWSSFRRAVDKSSQFQSEQAGAVTLTIQMSTVHKLHPRLRVMDRGQGLGMPGQPVSRPRKHSLIYGLFLFISRNSWHLHHKAQNGRMNDEFERKWWWPNRSTLTLFAWRKCGSSPKYSAKITCVPAEIRTD
jgi:hypothetical protein